MPSSFKIGSVKINRSQMSDPRVAMRILIGVLLAANLVAAVVAFKPFGGSAEDMRREQVALRGNLSNLDKQVTTARRLVDKVEAARREGDEFLSTYVMDMRTFSSTLGEELNRTAQQAGIRPLPSQRQLEPVEGSDTLYMASITGGYEGSYDSLKKFVRLLDKSPRFLIIENMSLASPSQQSGKVVNVTVKLDTFVRQTAEGAL